MTTIKNFLIKLLGLEFYVSPLDAFLKDYDKAHPRTSHSQHVEIKKYNRVYALRDNAVTIEPKKTIWDKF